jgi:hypothetical protein
VREHRAAAQELRRETALQDAGYVFKRDLMQQRREVVGTGRIDQNIDAAEFLDCCGNDGVRVGHLCNVAERKSDPRFGKTSGELRDRAFAALAAAAIDDNGLGARRQHRFRASLADAGGAAGDQCSLSLQRLHESALRLPQAST